MSAIRVFGFLSAITLLGSCTKTETPAPAPAPAPPQARNVEPVDERTSEIPAKREFPVNTAVNPCDNFYEYACSIPLSRFKLRPDRNRHIFSFTDSVERLLSAKKKFLAETVKGTDLSPRAQQLKDNYLACMNSGKRAAEEKFVVAAERKKSAAIDDRAAWLEFLGGNIPTVETGFIAMAMDANMEDPTKWDVNLIPDVRSLPTRKNYEDPAVIADFEKLVTEFFSSIGEPDPAGLAKAVVAFEIDFDKTYPELYEIYDRATEKKYYIDRPTLLKNHTNLKLFSVLEKIPTTTLIFSAYPESMEYLQKALATLPEKTIRAIYLHKALRDKLKDGYPKYYDAKVAFEAKHLGGAPVLPKRDEKCTMDVMAGFEKELDAELIDKLFPDFDRVRFTALVEKVRAAIERKTKANTWLSEEGRKGVLRKMTAARMQLASPANEEQWNFVPGAQYHPEKPLSNAKIRDQVTLDKMLADLQKPRAWDHWAMGPLTVNAYYNPADNKFIMLQGLLQYPFYDESMTDAEVLGAVGVVVGHELGHGFDDNGFKYDEKGVLEDWIPEVDREQFKKRTAILVEQFNAIVDPSINDHYGEMTLGENIADTAGLSFAYEAAFPEGKGTVEDKKAFYLQYGRLWCGTALPKEFENRLRTDVHAQTESRVNEPLKHQPGFHEVYGCKAGDKMFRPEDQRMVLW